MIIFLILFLVSDIAIAANDDIFPPRDINRSVNFGFDQSSLPPIKTLELFTNVISGYDRNDGAKWGRNTLQCLSDSSPLFGQCPTSPQPNNNNPLNVLLQFYDSDSKTSRSINVTVTRNPSTGSTNTIVSPLNPVWVLAYGARFSAWISMDEIKKLGPGMWSAQLKMGLYQNDSNDATSNIGKLADWSVLINLNIRDSGNVKIIFPEFMYSTPTVNFNFRFHPGTSESQQVSGVNKLDMCLFDGDNSRSNNIRIQFIDGSSNSANTESDAFHILRENADTSRPENRIDYFIEVFNPDLNLYQKVSSGVDMILTNTNKRSNQRLIIIPGVPGVSLCVAAPIVFTTNKFIIGDKVAGRYSGKVTLIYTPTTQ